MSDKDTIIGQPVERRADWIGREHVTPPMRGTEGQRDSWVSVVDRLPEVTSGDSREFIIACRRNNGKTYVFAAEYLNSKLLQTDDDDCPEDGAPFTGWYQERDDSSGEYDTCWRKVCEMGDAVTHWMPMPLPPEQSAASRCRAQGGITQQSPDWIAYHSALSASAELLDNMADGDPITDLPKFLAAKLAARAPADLSEAMDLMSKYWTQQWTDADGLRQVRFEYKRLEAAVQALAQERAAVPEGWRKGMRDLVRVLRGVECGDDGQWKFIANVCANADDLLAAPVAQEGEQSDLTTVDCPTCDGKGMVGGHVGQTPESYDEITMDCDECSGQGKIIVSRNDTTQPTPSKEGEQMGGDMRDAYVGAREDLAIWKKRALEAEDSCRRLTAALNNENGPTHMGEPVAHPTPSDSASVDTPGLLGRLVVWAMAPDGPDQDVEYRGIVSHIESLIAARVAGVRKDAMGEPDMLWLSDDPEMFAHGPDDFAKDYADDCLRPGEEAEVHVDCAYRGSKRTMRITVSKDADAESPVSWTWIDAAMAAHSPASGSKEGAAS